MRLNLAAFRAAAMDDEELVLEIGKAFLASQADQRIAVYAALARPDALALAHAVHKISGTLGYLCDQEASFLARDLEWAANERRLTDAAVLWTALEAALTILANDLNTALFAAKFTL